MLFSSMLFLWGFLPAMLIISFLLNLLPFQREENRIRAKNSFLLLASLIFYAWGGLSYLLIMLGTILVDYLGGLALGMWARTQKMRKVFLWITLVCNLGVLFFFKYFNMVVATVEAFGSFGEPSFWRDVIELKGTGALGIAEIALPVGISFFTFQSMSYVLDVYWEKTPAQQNLLEFALYVTLFPQLVAGPIVQYNDVAEQLKCRVETVNLFVAGQKRFCFGLAKKVIVANTMAEIADEVWALDPTGLGAGVAWLGLVAYTLQIYYDFSGYSDMAIGIGRMLGFRFRENFRYPYTSLSIREFWRRWHISLSSWFKEYVYIPLGGNRRSKLCTYRNIFFVFLLTGIWHGANFTFVVWGLLYALLQILERMFLGKLLEKNPIKLLNWAYVMFFVMIGWVYFRSDNILLANAYVGQLFTFQSSEYSVLSFLSMKALLVFIAAILGSGWVQRAFAPYLERVRGCLAVQAGSFLLQVALLVGSILLLVSGTYNPFIYFQF